jgi:hypothetical protein
MSSSLNMGGHTISNFASPTIAGDAANKAHVWMLCDPYRIVRFRYRLDQSSGMACA